jgi:hypothetical protein
MATSVDQEMDLVSITFFVPNHAVPTLRQVYTLNTAEFFSHTQGGQQMREEDVVFF